MKATTYQEIEIEKILPHPHNPRRELGDLTELAESMKVKGVLQNLTLIKGYAGDPSNLTADQLNADDIYTVVIGHRRLAAAKLAGLKTVPYVESDMDEREQIATMLAENALRTDLTYLEQAEGIQMMLNLGETVADITKRTGFSETTVRRRVSLLSHDRDKVESAFERGATLLDFAEIEKIDDPKVRAELLDVLGNYNFTWALRQAKQKQEAGPRKTEIKNILKSFAEEVNAQPPDTTYLRHLSIYGSEEVTVPDDSETRKYYYRCSDSGFHFYAQLLSTDLAEKLERDAMRAEEEREREERKMKRQTAFDARADFIKGMTEAKCKKVSKEIAAFAVHVFFGVFSWDGFINSNILLDILNYNPDEDANDGMDYDTHYAAEELLKEMLESGEFYRALLVSAYSAAEDNNDSWVSETYAALYGRLEAIGYVISDAEAELCETLPGD
ncbi:MAG: ParB/RepB/Spo0J family partition protein [Clostridiales Family XIII bacterium]|jgi:ParB family chromosome partitioning protein|nr:ParB/RepB/Spo0J family partition protein [Clostridiales Family XIII bacterium]